MASTIRDVALHAGVSIATVSRALRDPSVVSLGTRERVQRAVDELAFVPSQLGRQLAERRYAANGIVFPDLSGPYYAEVVLGYEDVTAELGRAVLILSTHGRPGAAQHVHRLAGRCDGLVVFGRTVADDVLEELADRGTPLVLLARTPLSGADRTDTVNAENTHAAHALAAHLADSGARTVTFLGDPSFSPDLAERLDGLRHGADARGLAVTAHEPGGMDEAAGAAAAAELAELEARSMQVQAEIDELKRRVAELEETADEVDDAIGEAEDARDEAQEAVAEATRERDAAAKKLERLS